MLEAVALLVIALLAAVDQIIKYVVLLRLKPVGTSMVIDNVFQLRYIENTGAAFSILENATTILSVVTAVVILLGLWAVVTKKIKSKFLYFCIVIVLAGGIGNFIDRVYRGFVIDYFEVLFVRFAVFNFADCLITVGAFMMIGYIVYEAVQEYKMKKGAKNE
ncbi:MAG TPA: signal peptidase II [Clostridia bacterium]|nr:signal peptidase II [Clostridia bacterium]